MEPRPHFVCLAKAWSDLDRNSLPHVGSIRLHSRESPTKVKYSPIASTEQGDDVVGGSRKGPSLEARIRASRSANLDGTRVVYDLAHGMDFSRPRATAEAIARVVWEEDVEGWWSLKEGRPVCVPTGTIEIRIPAEHNHRVAKAVLEFRKELMNEELADYLSEYLDSASEYEVSWPTFLLLGPVRSYLVEGLESRARRRERLESLFLQTSHYIRVSRL